MIVCIGGGVWRLVVVAGCVGIAFCKGVVSWDSCRWVRLCGRLMVWWLRGNAWELACMLASRGVQLDHIFFA